MPLGDSVHDNPEPRLLIRSFSDDLENRNPATSASPGDLQRILADGCAQDQQQQQIDENWRVYFEPWKPTAQVRKDAFLRREGVLLSASWKAFRDKLPENERAAFARRAPSVLDVIQTVTDASDAWEEKRRKGKFGIATKYFHKLAGNVNAHSTMLELLPAGNEYVSLFTGTIKSVIKASANHEKIAQGISKALCEITDAVASCTSICQIYNTEAVQMLIAKLYAHIFLFLKDTMTWYLDKHWKRLLNSFQENFYGEFDDQVVNIKKIAQEVKDQAQLGQSAELRTARLAIEDARLAASGQERATAELVHQITRLEERSAQEEQRAALLMLEEPERMKMLSSFIATHIFDLLGEQAQEWIEKRDAVMGAAAPQLLAGPERMLLEQAEPKTSGREEYLVASRNLEKYFDRDRIHLSFDVSSGVAVPNSVSPRLQGFINEPNAGICAIACPASRDELGTATKVACSFVAFADQAKLPVISHFCELRRSKKLRGDNTLEMQALVELVYSLIRQLIELLPLQPQTQINVDISALGTLYGKGATIEGALALVTQLLQSVTTTLACLFVVIDGLQWLDDSSTDSDLKRLIQALRPADNGEKPRFRVLLTTTGRSRALIDALDVDEYLLADQGGWGATKRVVGSALSL